MLNQCKFYKIQKSKIQPLPLWQTLSDCLQSSPACFATLWVVGRRFPALSCSHSGCRLVIWTASLSTFSGQIDEDKGSPPRCSSQVRRGCYASQLWLAGLTGRKSLHKVCQHRQPWLRCFRAWASVSSPCSQCWWVLDCLSSFGWSLLPGDLTL